MTSKKRSGAPIPHRILVVDDDPETASIVRAWFRDETIEIDEAPNGREGSFFL